MPNICQMYEIQKIQKIKQIPPNPPQILACQIFEKNLPNILYIFAKYEPKICKLYAKFMPIICKKNTYMSQIWLTAKEIIICFRFRPFYTLKMPKNDLKLKKSGFLTSGLKLTHDSEQCSKLC